MKLPPNLRTGLLLCALGLLLLVFLGIRSCDFLPVQHSREAVLRTDLRTIRDAIDNYALDKKKAPRSLQDLVEAGYLRAIPVDPTTLKPDWELDFGVPILGDPVLSPDLRAEGLVNVHSNSSRVAGDGSQYKTW